MRLCFSILLLLFFFTTGLKAQIYFEKILGGKGDQFGFGVAVTTGGFAACGHTALPGSLVTDAWVLRFNEEGDTLWTRKYGGTGIDNARSLIIATDSSIVVCGTYSHTGPPKADFYLLRITLDGDTTWTRNRFSALNAYGYSVAPATGGFILCGYADVDRSTPRMMLVRTDEYGDTLWTRIYGDTAATTGFSAIQTNDGGFIACGYIDSFEPDWNRNIYVVRTNGNGDTVWTRNYPNTGYDISWSISGAGSGYVLTGYRDFMGSVGTNLYIVRLDEDGSVLWEKNYGQSGLDIGYSGIQTSDGGFVFCGQSNEQGNEYQPLYLVRTDATGDTLWTRLLGSYPKNAGTSVQETWDGGFIIAGGTTSASTDGLYDLYLVRTDEDGTITFSNTIPPAGASVPVYPNPSDGTFGFTSDQPVINIEVLDIKGISVFEEHPAIPVAGTHKITLPGHLKGCFLFRITTLQNTFTGKVLVY